MNLDDEICCCYHVSLRKLLNYTRREQPKHASQLSNCLGAGTGCGWCIPVLKRIHGATINGESAEEGWLPGDLPSNPEQYHTMRKSYISSGHKNTF